MREDDGQEKERRRLQVTAAIEIPETRNEEEEGRERKRERREKAGLWVNGAIAAFTFIAAFAAIKAMYLTADAVREATRSANASIRANKLARDQFSATQRPRVRLQSFAVKRGYSE